MSNASRIALLSIGKWLGLATILAVEAATLPAGAATYQTVYAPAGTGDGAGPTGGFVDVGGTLYGTTSYGGATGNGTIVSLDPASGKLTKLHDFSGGADGFFPQGNLLHVGNLLFGATPYGGAHNQGTVFTYNPATRAETVVWSFSGAEGIVPVGTLVALGGNIYGTTQYGGANGQGTVFELVPSTGTVTALYAFGGTGDAAHPTAGLVQSGSLLYGTSAGGGANGGGGIYAIDPSTGKESVVYSFVGGTDASTPEAALVAAGGVLYGTSLYGGTNGVGTLYAFNPATAKETVLHSFAGAADGEVPEGNLTAASGLLYGATPYGGPSGGGTLFSLSLKTNALTILHAFGLADGESAIAAPLLLSGVLYGTTEYGGSTFQGSVYALSVASGAQTILHSFTGSTPIESLGLTALGTSVYALASNGGSAGAGSAVAISAASGTAKVLHAFTTAGGFSPGGSLMANGGLFGFTPFGGNAGCGGLGCGTVFEISPKTGAQTQIYAFPAATAETCSIGDLLNVGGTVYGTTCSGGVHGFGTVFKVDPATGTQTTIYSFAGGTDGTYPFAALLYVKGTLYGTTSGGGAHGAGTVFRINLANATETVAYAFSGPVQTQGNGDAALPYSGLIDVGGILYGTTFAGGAYGWGAVYGFNPASGAVRILHSFQPNGTDGTQPGGNMISLNGLLYGMTVYGGTGGAGCGYNACGTVFAIDPASGAETIVHAFAGGLDGGNPPYAPLVAVGGTLYGSTGSAGAHGLGTVFSLTP